MKQASHKSTASTSTLRLLPEFGLIDLSDPCLSERLAGRVSEQLELFASQMRQGLLAASVAIGLGASLLAIAIAIGIGVLFGVYPAGRAAKLAPIDALRSE